MRTPPAPFASPLKPLSGPIPRWVENDSQNIIGRKSLSLAGWPLLGARVWGQGSIQKAGDVTGELESSAVGDGTWALRNVQKPPLGCEER